MGYSSTDPYRVPRIGVHSDGMLAVLCWCQGEIVRAPASEIAAGRTRSCGARDCNEDLITPHVRTERVERQSAPGGLGEARRSTAAVP